MNQLSPYENFLIVKQLEDAADANVYYVRVVIKDADGTTLDTVNLTDNGSQFFSKLWRVVADKTINGSGRFITMTTSVYTDSGYTTLSTLYATTAETFLIQRRLDANVALGGGGGVIDYREVAKIVADEIKKIPKTEFPKQELPKATDFAPIIKEITKTINDKIDNAIGGIPTPERPEKVDLSSLNAGLQKAIKEITSRPKFEKTDLSELVLTINKYTNEMRTTLEDNKQEMAKYFERFKEEIINSISDENAKLKLLNGLRDGSIGFQIGTSPEEKKKKGYLESLKKKYNL